MAGKPIKSSAKFDIPIREVAIVATESGFYPSTIMTFVGERVQIYLTSTTNYPSCLMMPEKSVFMSATKGELTEKVTFFNKPGVVKCSCPNGNIKGEFVVLKKRSRSKKPDDERGRASVYLQNGPKVKIWFPKDE